MIYFKRIIRILINILMNKIKKYKKLKTKILKNITSKYFKKTQ